MDRRALLGGMAVACLPGWVFAQSGPRSDPGAIAGIRFQPVAPWIDLVRVVSEGPQPDVFRMRVSGARSGVSAFVHDGQGRLLGMAGGPAAAVAGPLLTALASRPAEDGVVDPVETVLWRGEGDTSTRTGGWRTADADVNAAVEAVANLLAPPTSTGWLVSWSPRHFGAEGGSDITLGGGEVPDLEGVVWELMAEDRLFTFVRSPAIDRFMKASAGRFVFQTQSMDGLGLGTMVVLQT